jgi:hypothetical protein
MIQEVPDEVFPADDPKGKSFHVISFAPGNPDIICAAYERGLAFVVYSRSKRAPLVSVENPYHA